jgi:hypothetical protein
MKKNFKMISVLLTVVLLMSVFVSPVAAEQGNGEGQNNLPAQTSSLTEAEIEAIGAEILREAEASVTPEQITEAYKIMEETERFLSSLNPETIWEAYLDENPEITYRRMSKGKLSEIKREVNTLFETMTVDGINSPKYISSSYIPSSALLAYTRHFSGHDGVGVVGRTAIEANGNSASNDAASVFPNDAMRQDAYRHYLWNFSAVRNIAVHVTQDGRIRSTRIYTTNRELATNILRRFPDLNVAEPTATQLATALNLRNNFFNRTFAQWDALFTDEGGRDDLMDLWNNVRGRQDGVTGPNQPLTLFNNRWDANTVIRSNRPIDVTPARRQTIWINSWYVP